MRTLLSRCRILAWCFSLVFVPLASAADVTEGSTSVSIRITTLEGRILPPESKARLRVFVHEDRPAHRVSAPTCEPTNNDTNDVYSFTGWHLPDGGMTYLVNASRAPRAFRAVVTDPLRRAQESWTNADPDKALTDGGSTKIARPRYDGRNVILWKLLPRRTVAVAYIWYLPETGEVLDADMVFNERLPWAINNPDAGDCGGDPKAYDLQAVATHEFGHWFGLDDLYDPVTADLTMHGFVTLGELKKVTLGTGDTLGIAAVAP